MSINGKCTRGVKPPSPRYILITECLQNDFFLNRESQLCLPKDVVGKMLLGKKWKECMEAEQGPKNFKRICKDSSLTDGPLGRFLQQLMKWKNNDDNGILHIIHIRDFHRTDSSYGRERIAYGPHCLAGTWGASYIDGLAHLIAPGQEKDKTESPSKLGYFREGSIRIYHLTSSSLFDFRPHMEPSELETNTLEYLPSALESILDVLLMGTPEEVSDLEKVNNNERDLAKLAKRAQNLKSEEEAEEPPDIYVAVIGVYTDIKIRMLLTSLRSRYEIRNLAVSDTLTASPTTERHLAALDFISRVLDVEVIHGIRNLLLFLGGKEETEGEPEDVATEPFALFQRYVLDKQNVLSYEYERLQEYLRLTQKRSLRVYHIIELANWFLLGSGICFFALSLAGIVYNFLPGRALDWKLPLLSGGVGLAQVVSLLFARPMSDMQRNLTNLTTLRMILQSHSLKTALARFHLTTPHVLTEKINEELATKQMDIFARQLEILKELDIDYSLLKELGFDAQGPAAQGEQEEAASAG